MEEISNARKDLLLNLNGRKTSLTTNCQVSLHIKYKNRIIQLETSDESGESSEPHVLLPTKEPDNVHWNDGRYTGELSEYIRDPNDSRYDPDDPRHLDDYYNP